MQMLESGAKCRPSLALNFMDVALPFELFQQLHFFASNFDLDLSLVEVKDFLKTVWGFI